ncbi:DUF6256 family protein [Streptomyces sp. H51]|uniref:DUF6256 family protein n=1 Tax=Streptomyces sp. H51 TaxID=3111770 RepID=UPI002D790876|nr:DUF6256 family protein [Streptomyces sp. H51]
MLVGYLLVMGCLAFGLHVLRRGARRPVPVPSGERGWPALIRKVAGTAVGGYLLLMAVVVGYYQGVARVGGHFLASAFTGCALLIGTALPVLLAASWVTERRARASRRVRRRRG